MRIVLPLTFFLMMTGCSPGYVLRGAWEEFRILSRREPIEKIIEEKKYSDDTRAKLALVLEARDFGKDKGLDVGRSYSQYAEVDSSALVWVLTAAPKLKLEPKTWWFPFVGSVPYKGFFEKEDALKLKEKLEADGYDVFVRPSSAFSTLGWFNDPVLSTMLRGDQVSLVDTILHEILHRTIWVKGDVEFNESLANFVGGTFSEQFFRTKDDLAASGKAINRKVEELEFGDFIAEVCHDLEDIYNSDLSDEEKLVKREALLEEERIKWTARGPTEYYSLVRFPLNNASLLSLRVYLKELRLFEELYNRCERDSQRFLAQIKDLVSRSERNLFDESREALEQGAICVKPH